MAAKHIVKSMKGGRGKNQSSFLANLIKAKAIIKSYKQYIEQEMERIVAICKEIYADATNPVLILYVKENLYI